MTREAPARRIAYLVETPDGDMTAETLVDAGELAVIHGDREVWLNGVPRGVTVWEVWTDTRPQNVGADAVQAWQDAEEQKARWAEEQAEHIAIERHMAAE